MFLSALEHILKCVVVIYYEEPSDFFSPYKSSEKWLSLLRTQLNRGVEVMRFVHLNLHHDIFNPLTLVITF